MGPENYPPYFTLIPMQKLVSNFYEFSMMRRHARSARKRSIFYQQGKKNINDKASKKFRKILSSFPHRQ
jgi:hypothetical protein